MPDSNRGRDLRDPEKLGQLLRAMVRDHGVPVLLAANEAEHSFFIPDYVSPDTVGRYGRPDEVKPLFMEVQVR